MDNKLDRLHVLNDSLSDCSLIDMWHKQHPRWTSYTWANSNYSQASRLDRFLIFFKSCIDCPTVFPCSFSDHDFVALTFSPDDYPRTRSGVWKYNSSLLHDVIFKCELPQLITDQKQFMANFQTIGVWWDNLKVLIHNFCQKYCSCKRKSTNCFRTSLTNHLIRAKMISLAVMSQGLQRFGILNALSLCERRRGHRSDPARNGLKKEKYRPVISFVVKIKELLKVLVNL